MISSDFTGFDDTIVALATPGGVGAIGVIRLSGNQAIEMANGIFSGKDLCKQPSHTTHFGRITEGDKVIDEVLASIFIAPRSFTKENVVEISTHGSPYIIQQIIKLLLDKGARLARAGEFTKRAFINGQFDLAQAEAVADLISADNEAAHKAAMHQMRGGFSTKINDLRSKLIHFASLVELELDFAEEDVEFADRTDLIKLIDEIQQEIKQLIDSFKVGNVIKNGVPTVIAGKPNAGKSTLLNTLLQEEKAIVSEIPGTTRDVIEDEMHIEGIRFRFIDTAGIREAKDKIEAIGVARTQQQMQAASVIIFLVDVTTETEEEIHDALDKLKKLNIPYLLTGNKADRLNETQKDQLSNVFPGILFISASQEQHIDELKSALTEIVNLDTFRTGDTIVTNIRHIEALTQAQKALHDTLQGIQQQVSGDLLALDIRQALHHLGEITGKITTDDLLGNIFSKFCIGK